MEVSTKTAPHRVTRKIHNPDSTSSPVSASCGLIVGPPADSYRKGTKPPQVFPGTKPRQLLLCKNVLILVNSGGEKRDAVSVNTKSSAASFQGT